MLKKNNANFIDNENKKIKYIANRLEEVGIDDVESCYDYYEEKLKKSGVDYKYIMNEVLNKYAEKTMELLKQAENRKIRSEVSDVRIRFLNLIVISKKHKEILQERKWSEYFEYCSDLMSKF